MAGPSGSGKTTVLNLLGGLTRPSRGKVWIDGREISDLPDKELAKVRLSRIGFVFQSYNLLPAEENAEFTMLLQGVPARNRRERVRRLFAEIGLEGLEDRMPPKLSGGQQQRVAVVRAVLAEPALVLADEPTANLDSTMAEALLDAWSCSTIGRRVRTDPGHVPRPRGCGSRAYLQSPSSVASSPRRSHCGAETEAADRVPSNLTLTPSGDGPVLWFRPMFGSVLG